MTKLMIAVILAAGVMATVAGMGSVQGPVLEGLEAQSIAQRIERALQPPRPRTPTNACACVRG